MENKIHPISVEFNGCSVVQCEGVIMLDAGAPKRVDHT
jgi:hypothetical protein